jgi:hypothetical protein
MPGDGTPADAPINTPGLDVTATPASIAFAGDHESANTLAAANRALLISFICLAFLFCVKRVLTGWIANKQAGQILLLEGHKEKPELFLNRCARNLRSRLRYGRFEMHRMKSDDVLGPTAAFSISRAKQAKDRLRIIVHPSMSSLGELRDQFQQAF